MDRNFIQQTIYRVEKLFRYAEAVDSPTIKKLDEKLWKTFALVNNYTYPDKQ